MTPEERILLIEERLRKKLHPSHLEVEDNSEEHRGHAGASGGAGHYTVIISSTELNSLTRVAAHQAIYAALSDLIPHEIHALKIKIIK